MSPFKHTTALPLSIEILLAALCGLCVCAPALITVALYGA